MPNKRHNLRYESKDISEAAKETRLSKRSIRVAKLVMCRGMTYEEAGNVEGMTKQQAWAIVKNMKTKISELELANT